MLCSDAIAAYLRSRIAAGLTRAYVSRCRRQLLSFTQFTPVALVADLRPVHVTEYLADRLKRCKASTVAGDRAAVLTWLRWLTLEEEIEDHRWSARVQKIKQPKPLVRALTQEETRLFLMTAEFAMPHRTELARRRDYAMVCMLVDAGLRESELLALRMEDVDLQHCCARVKHGKGDKERIALFGERTQAARAPT